jgi:hypothetical protein
MLVILHNLNFHRSFVLYDNRGDDGDQLPGFLLQSGQAELVPPASRGIPLYRVRALTPSKMEMLLYIWRSYPVLIDFLLYFLVFGAAARVSFAKFFPGHEGRMLSFAVGLFLAAGLAMAQRTLGFSTEKMGPVAAFILDNALDTG